MMVFQKIQQCLFYTLLIYFLPMIGCIDRFFTWPVGISIAMGWFTVLSQPYMPLFGKSDKQTDAGSAFFLTLAYMACMITPLVWYGYFFNADLYFFHPYTITGIGLIILGLSFRYYSIRVLGAYFTSEVEIKDDHQVIQHGPYRILRHPSYLGALISVIGNALVYQNLLVTIPIAVCFMPAYAYRIHQEEKVLTQSFGQAYTDYKQKTWKLIPYVF